MSDHEFIAARHFTPQASRHPSIVVVHTMEATLKAGTARAVARYFAGMSAPQASAHYCIDPREIIQCVQEHDVAWHAPGTNGQAIGIEHAGWAYKTDWACADAKAMLELSAELVANICLRYNIPVTRLDADSLLAGRPGITGHSDVSKACRLAHDRRLIKSPFYAAHTDHQDPGPNWPWDDYLAAIVAALPDGPYTNAA